MTPKEKAINKINERLARFGEAQIYIHGYSQTPLNEKDKKAIFEKYRSEGRKISSKINSHNVEYYLIS